MKTEAKVEVAGVSQVQATNGELFAAPSVGVREASQVCPPLAFFYLEEDDVWAAVGEDVNVTFTHKRLKPIPQTEKPKGDTTKPPSMPVQSAWDKAVNEALAADVCFALFAKLRNQRP